jgi:hypothetical protein
MDVCLRGCRRRVLNPLMVFVIGIELSFRARFMPCRTRHLTRCSLFFQPCKYALLCWINCEQRLCMHAVTPDAEIYYTQMRELTYDTVWKFQSGLKRDICLVTVNIMRSIHAKHLN